MKRNTMAQWMKIQRNNSFVNLCKKCGAILLVLVGLTAGCQAGRRAGGRAGRQADKTLVDLKILKLLYRSHASLRFHMVLTTRLSRFFG